MNSNRLLNWPCLILHATLCLAMPTICQAANTARIETPFFSFTVSGDDGSCEIVDKQTGVTWRNPPGKSHFGWLQLSYHEEPLRIELGPCEVHASGTDLTAGFTPFPARAATHFVVRARALPDGKTLEFAYEEDNELQVDRVSLLDQVLSVTDDTQGYVVIPAREGLLIPANSGIEFNHSFDTSAYEGCHMEMFGVVKAGAAAMATWDDPYVAAELKSTLSGVSNAPARQTLTPSLILSSSARTFQLHFLGRGDYVAIAKAYRAVARKKGLLVTWDQKLKHHPERAKLFGAANIKLWSALTRRMNAASTAEESVHVNWTFSEAAQVAEHYKHDLKLDRVLFTLGGWIHRGYDNQHPDILPTAPECGGNAAFSDCARRVLKLGYLFCLHDNYQDIYRDSPSWNENLLMRTDDQKLAKGGRWAGGQAYLICSREALGLARRPQNLPGVKKLSRANAYFIDTTYAAGLQECYDPAHALTRRDDMKWKQRLSDYARSEFGVFGSEDGREWAIPHSDFFEGLTGVSGHYYHDATLLQRLGASPVPLFDLVYHDCIAMYGKYGYDPREAADYVLYHITLGRPLNYHSIPPHLYWEHPAKEPDPKSGPALFMRGDQGWTEGLHPLDRFIKNTYEILSPLNELTARLQMSDYRFLTRDRKVQRSVFGEGEQKVTAIVNMSGANYACASQFGGTVTLPPFGFLVESPGFVAFSALDWNGVHYDSPPLFTLRSLDHRPLTRSRKVRVYHGFGEDSVRIGAGTFHVRKETVLDATRT